MEALPLERACTFPEASIVATLVFDEDHDTGVPVDPVALSVPVDPTASMSERSDVNVMPVEPVIGVLGERTTFVTLAAASPLPVAEYVMLGTFAPL